MDKKGFVQHFVFGLLGLFILMLVVVTLLPIHYNPSLAENMTNNLDYSNYSFHERLNNPNSSEVVVNIVYKFADALIFASFEIAKLAVNIGIERPDIFNPVVLIYLIFLALFSPFIISLLKAGIIIFILIKEYFQSKKEKNKLKQLKNERLQNN